MTFFSGKKESHQRKLPWERERAERSSGHRFAGPLGFDLLAGGDAGDWLVLPLVRQQLHALLDLVRLRCARCCRLWVIGSPFIVSPAGGGQGLATSGCGTTTVLFINRRQSLP